MVVRNISRLLVPALVASVLSGLAGTASWACGCGALIPSGNSSVAVAQESSIVRFNGAAEQIVMRLSVRTQAHDAAWLMPTPSRASVSLGKDAWFDELDGLAAPKVVKHHHLWPSLSLGSGNERATSAAARPGVTVLGQQRLGPFQVASLAAADPAALTTWLSAHGYRLPKTLSESLKPYVRQHWTYTAIKLAPREGSSLTGTLDPLSLTFAAPTLVYPIRLSRLASSAQFVHLYLLAPHRVRLSGGDLPMSVTYAGRITPADVSPDLRPLVGTGTFMTDLVGSDLPPSLFTDDLHFTYTADTPYQQVDVEDGGLIVFLGVPVYVWILLGLLVAASALVIAVIRRVHLMHHPAHQ
jgi:Uncharacterized protein conserved in bacteria (DUF2330)